MHCPFLIKPGEEPPKGAQFAILCRFENSCWSQNYVAGIRKMVHLHDYFPSIWIWGKLYKSWRELQVINKKDKKL